MFKVLIEKIKQNFLAQSESLTATPTLSEAEA
jgi:hypothetical protein